MTTGLAQPYAKRGVERTPARLPDWLQTEFGNIERALRIPVAATSGYFTLTDPQFGGDNTGRRDNAPAMRKILALIASGRTSVRGIYAPGGTYLFRDNFTLTGGLHDDVTLFGDGTSTVFQLADSPNRANVEAGWMCMLTGTASAPLRNVLIRHLLFDGNRDGTDWTDSSYGVVGYTDAVLEHCLVAQCWARHFRSSGFTTFTGGLAFVDVDTHDNTDHGISVSIDTTFTGYAIVQNQRASGNGGYGLDAGRGCRTVVRGLEAWGNTEGGFKYSIGTAYLNADGIHTYENGVAGDRGPGVTDTDTTGTGTIIFGTVVTHDNIGPGFRCTAADTLSIGRLISYDNQCYVAGAVAAYDTLLGDSNNRLRRFDADLLSVTNAPNGGIFVDGGITSYQIGRVEATGCGDWGFYDQCTGPTSAAVGQMRFRNNNQDGNVGSAGAALAVERDGPFHVDSLLFEDDQGSPTQTAGVLVSLGCDFTVDKVDWGNDITTTWFVSSSGTTVNQANNWQAVRAITSTATLGWDDNTVFADATSGAITVNLRAATNMTGKVYTIKKTDASANAVTVDPNGTETVDGAATYALTVQYQSVTIACDGTNWYIL